MARVGRSRLSYRTHMRHFATSAKFPRWITVPFILTFGLILWLAVLSGRTGHLRTIGAGSALYLAAVIGLAALLAGVGQSGDSSRKDGK